MKKILCMIVLAVSSIANGQTNFIVLNESDYIFEISVSTVNPGFNVNDYSTFTLGYISSPLRIMPAYSVSLVNNNTVNPDNFPYYDSNSSLNFDSWYRHTNGGINEDTNNPNGDDVTGPYPSTTVQSWSSSEVQKPRNIKFAMRGTSDPDHELIGADTMFLNGNAQFFDVNQERYKITLDVSFTSNAVYYFIYVMNL